MSGYSLAAWSLEDIKSCIEKRLFVSNLPSQKISEESVRSCFSKFGQISEIKILADKGICYVGFGTWTAAHQALLEIDHRPLPGHGGKPVTVTFASRSTAGDRKSFQKGDSNCRVYIEGLRAITTESGVRGFCKGVAAPTFVKLIPKGKTTCALVTFRIWGEAADAVEQLNYNDRGISVTFAWPPVTAGHEARADVQKDDSWWYSDEWYDDAGWHHQGSSWLQWDEEFEELKTSYMQALDDEAISEFELTDMHNKLLHKRRQAFGIPDKGAIPIGAAVDKKLLLSGLPEGFTEKELEKMLSMLTESDDLEPVELPSYKMASSTSAILEFNSHGTADKARRSLDDSTLEYRGDQPNTLRAVWFSETRAPRPRQAATVALGRRIFIARCKKGLQIKDVRPHVEEFGEVVDVRPLENRGVVYVTFAKEQDAQKAVEGLNDAAIPTMSIRPEVKLIVEIAKAD